MISTVSVPHAIGASILPPNVSLSHVRRTAQAQYAKELHERIRRELPEVNAPLVLFGIRSLTFPVAGSAYLQVPYPFKGPTPPPCLK